SFTVTTNPINTSTFVNITGSYSGTQTVGTLQVTAIHPGISSVSFAPSSVGGGATSTGTVTLTSPAITGGTVVALSSDNAVATVPATVTVAAHATTANFTVNTTQVSSATTANISATLNGASVTAQLTVSPPTVLSVSLNPTSIVGGTSVTSTGTVTLTGPAPSG